MGLKRYISKTGIQYTFPVSPKGSKVVFVSFNGSCNDFETSDSAVQALIEAHPKFKSEEICVIILSADEENEETSSATLKEIAEVTDLQAAVDYLKGKPYNIDSKSLKTPKAIKKKAEELGLTFPNLNV